MRSEFQRKQHKICKSQEITCPLTVWWQTFVPIVMMLQFLIWWISHLLFVIAEISITMMILAFGHHMLSCNHPNHICIMQNTMYMCFLIIPLYQRILVYLNPYVTCMREQRINHKPRVAWSTTCRREEAGGIMEQTWIHWEETAKLLCSFIHTLTNCGYYKFGKLQIMQPMPAIHLPDQVPQCWGGLKTYCCCQV